MYNRIQTATTTTLIQSRNIYGGSIKKVSVCNNSLEEATIDLFVEDDNTNVHFIVKNLAIPSGVTLILEDNINFDDLVYSLKLTNSGTSPDLSIIIK